MRQSKENKLLMNEMKQMQEFVFSHAKQLNITRESILSVIEELCIRISKVMKCDRVGIWLFNEDRTNLTAQNIYCKNTSDYTAGQVLTVNEAPSYFAAVQSTRILEIGAINEDFSTKELLEHPLYENGKYNSLLDASIILSKGIGGVICCETIEKREWSAFDGVLLASIADMLSFIFDRVERLEVEAHMHTLAYRDPLTGLDNQYAFTEKVNEQLKRMNEGKRGIFMYLILDQYSEVQGVLGHEGADQMLKITAERLKKIFPLPAHTARLAFDHFIIFFETDGEFWESKKMMDFIANELRHPMYICGQEVYMTFSYGISIYPDHALNVKYGIQSAKMALQSAQKTSNRKSRGIYEPDMHTYLKETMLSEMNLRRGLDFNEFKLFYQPQVNCRTGEVTGFEALIRWQHPERGLILPGDFIDLAESTGLITPMGEWVIQEAVAQLKKWDTPPYDKLTISVNVSPRHFLHHNFPFYLHQCMSDSGISPERLVLEITENVALEDQKAVTSRINLLTEMGYAVSIDDFGKGYSAFIYLQHFPIQQIKIDRQFINGLGKDTKSIGIVQTIIHLAELLGLQTIGEGVETKEQWDILKQLGCTELQGFYFSKPVPIEEINRQFLNHHQIGKLFLPVQMETTTIK